MTADLDEVRALIVPTLAQAQIDLYDLKLTGGSGTQTLRVIVDRPSGIDLEMIADASRRVSAVLDDVEVVSGSYTLEVTSPGVERPLRTVAHFQRAVGELVSIKYITPDGPRRIRGSVVEVLGDGVRVDTESGPITIDLDDVTKARTVFEWGPAPKPGSGTRLVAGGSSAAGSDERSAKERARQ